MVGLSGVSWLNDYGKNQGWNTTEHLRRSVNLNDDGVADILAIHDDRIVKRLSTSSGFTAEQGNIIWREERRAYGEIKVDLLKPKTLEEFSVGFTGHQADRESGLTMLRLVTITPVLGVFTRPTRFRLGKVI